jgi:large repetitive protein
LEIIPANTTYITNSTFLNGIVVADVSGTMPYTIASPINSPSQFSGILIQDTTPAIDDNEAIVKFRVTVNIPIPSGIISIDNQAILSAKDSISVQSDDPSKPGVTDPTTISVGAISPIIAIDDNYITIGTTPVTLLPLTGDTSIGTGVLIITNINGTAIVPGTAYTIPVTGGIVTVSATGSIIFTPSSGFIGASTFPYTISDGNSTATANETITITPPANAVCSNIIDNGGFDTDIAAWTATQEWIWNNGTAAFVTDNVTNKTISQNISGFSINSGFTTFKIILQPAEANNTLTEQAVLKINFGGTSYLTINNPIGTGAVTYTVANGASYSVDTTVRNQLATIYLTVPAADPFPKLLEFSHMGGDDDWYIYNVESLVCTTSPPVAADDNYTTTGTNPVTLLPLTGDSTGSTILSISGVLLNPGIPQIIPVPNGTVNITST